MILVLRHVHMIVAAPDLPLSFTKARKRSAADGQQLPGEEQDQQLGLLILLLSASARQINGNISHLFAGLRKKERELESK